MLEETRLNDRDRSVLDKVESYLAQGLEIHRWFQEARRTSSFAERFKLFDQYERPDTNYGFIDDITVGGRPFPITGTVQEILYARPKVPANASGAEWMRDQIRAYMLRYFMRVASFRAPRLTATRPQESPFPFLKPLSWCAGGPVNRRGWGYRQLYYKLTNGDVGKFPESQQRAIVDVRELGEKYQWIVLEVHVFDFRINLPPFGGDGLKASIPVKSVVKVVLSRDFVIDREHPEPGVLGRYGWGYAFLREEQGPTGLLGYGPDALGPAVMTFHFDVLEGGEARLFNGFAANQPTQIVHLSLNPVDWGVEMADLLSLGLLAPVLKPVREVSRRLPFSRLSLRPVFNFINLANLASGGLASRELCISKDQLLKIVMAMHFLDTYHFALGTLETWNQIADWTDDAALPRWIAEGRSS